VANDSRANWKVIRYADVLLMLAEALNENGKTTEALNYLNHIRVRAGVPQYSTLTKEATREKIYLERRLELSFEGVRWFDLVRTGRAHPTMQKVGTLPYMTVFPVPLSQVQLINNPTIFPQNEGYN
jgi:starch-binding outer membrane protein, SusD/RagB family